MGYCGHFAWIQCICRKCGDEWSWYDKVRFNPDKTVNQTELDSLKLNGTAPLILTNSAQKTNDSSSKVTVQQVIKVTTPTPAQQQQVQPTQQQAQPQQQQQAQDKKQQTATLTTLLIPDLSDTNGKLDLNDIPDENSEKFLDYLAKNHEKLVQATSNSKQQTQENGGDDENSEESEDQLVSTSTVATEDEAIEIQISSTRLGA